MRQLPDRDISFPQYFNELNRKGELHKLLDPSPEDAAEYIWNSITASPDPTVHVIYAASMFSGKTTAACLVADLAQQSGRQILAFQPSLAQRHGEVQETALVTKDGLTLSAIMTEPNLNAVAEYVLKDENPKNERPLVVIDEAMMYLDQKDTPHEAIDIIETIRNNGMDVILTGITRTFAAEPFTFMQHLVDETAERPHWHSAQMSTVCVYCGETALGTRRNVIDKNGTKKIARKTDPFLEAGTDQYEPVCMKEHKSYAEE